MKITLNLDEGSATLLKSLSAITGARKRAILEKLLPGMLECEVKLAGSLVYAVQKVTRGALEKRVAALVRTCNVLLGNQDHLSGVWDELDETTLRAFAARMQGERFVSAADAVAVGDSLAFAFSRSLGENVVAVVSEAERAGWQVRLTGGESEGSLQ